MSVAMTINKIVDPAGQIANQAGEVLTYTIDLTNIGNVTLTGIQVSDINTDLNTPDSVLFVSGDTNKNGTLDVGEIWVYSATHTVTQTELDNNGAGNGFIDNTATASSDQAGSITASAQVPVEQNPAMTINKIVDPAGQIANQAGEVLTYTIDLTNIGNVTLTGIKVSDINTDLNTPDSVLFVSGDTNKNGALDVGETWVYSATHTVTQTELDNNGAGNGFIDNTATASSDQAGSIAASAQVPVEHNPAMTINKIVDPAGQIANQAGEVLTYTIDLTNIGNVTLTGIKVSDINTDLNTPDSVLFVSGDTNKNGALDVGETWVYSATHAVTQTELDNSGAGNGFIGNTATASSDQTGSITASAQVPVVVNQPLISNPEAFTYTEGAGLSPPVDLGNKIANDVDPNHGGVISFQSFDAASFATASSAYLQSFVSHLTVSVAGNVISITDTSHAANNTATVTVNSTGDEFLSDPNNIFAPLNGGDSIVLDVNYHIQDNLGLTAADSQTITVMGVTRVGVVADRTHVNVGHSVTADVAHGVLANDTDPIPNDKLHVSAVNGQAGNVGHTIKGAFGTLTLNSDGSYKYVASSSAVLPADGVNQDVFTYAATTKSGDATADSTLTVVVTAGGLTYFGGTAGTTVTSPGGHSPVLDGGAGNDKLVATNGATVLIGGPGDTLTGGQGADTYVFTGHFGQNTITNYNASKDVIELDKTEFGSLGAVKLAATQPVGTSNTVIADNAGDSITLIGVTPSHLHFDASHFLLV